jgi:hypothetical protein
MPDLFRIPAAFSASSQVFIQGSAFAGFQPVVGGSV